MEIRWRRTLARSLFSSVEDGAETSLTAERDVVFSVEYSTRLSSASLSSSRISRSLSAISFVMGVTNVCGIHPKRDPPFLIAAHQPSVHLTMSKISFFLKDNNSVSEEVKSNIQRAENMTDSGLPDCELVSDTQVELSEMDGVLGMKRCRGAGEMGSCSRGCI